MGWTLDEAPGHEGYPAYLTRDGRTTAGSNARGVLVDLPEADQTWKAAHAEGRPVRNEDMYELVSYDDVVGWQNACDCGWRGSTWDRAAALSGDDSPILDAESAYLPDGSTVEDAARDEWLTHVTPVRHLEDIRAAAGKVTRARAELDTAVAQARESGQSWSAIGDAVGITKQAAYERWSHLGS